MKNDTRSISEAAGVAAVWALSGERLSADRSVSPDDPAYAFARSDRVIDPVLFAEVREMDSLLRSIAGSESPDLADMARARTRAIEATRLFAADRLNRRPLRAKAPLVNAPRWAIASAAAAIVAVGFVAWLATAVPTVDPPTVARQFRGEEAVTGQSEDASRYQSLMTAFNSLGNFDASGGRGLDDLQTEVDALSGLTSVEN